MADPIDTDIVSVTWATPSRSSNYDGYLGLKRSTLRRDVADYFGYVEAYDRLNQTQQRQVDSAINRGLRQFYYPEAISGQRASHQWSFLKPTVTFATVAEANRYAMPLDFGGIVGDLQYETDSDANLRNTRLQVTSMHEVNEAERQKRWENSGVPRLAAIHPRELQGSTTTSTRYVLRLYPTPDAVYNVRMTYNALGPSASVDGDDTSSQDRFLVGSSQHAETILSSCLSIAEQMADSRNRNTRQQEQFLRRLSASVLLDQQSTSPETVGIMTDPSILRMDSHRSRRGGYISNITYEG